jgi:Domain of unknown function DUF11
MRATALFTFVAALGLAVSNGASVARAEETPTGDIAIVSQTANVLHARIGDQVTFTVVAVNNGPDAVEMDVVEDPAQLYPGEFPPSDFQLVDEICDFGVSPDTPACEYSSIEPGELVTTVMVTQLKPTATKYASNTVCTSSENGIDPDQSNNCATTSIRVVGKRLK